MTRRPEVFPLLEHIRGQLALPCLHVSLRRLMDLETMNQHLFLVPYRVHDRTASAVLAYVIHVARSGGQTVHVFLELRVELRHMR